MAPKGTPTLRRRSTTRSEPAPLPANAEEARRMARVEERIAAAKGVRNGNVSKTVLEFATKHPGVLMHVNEIAEATDLSPEQVRNAVRRFIEDGSTGTWTVNLRGSAWTYMPPKPERQGEWLMVEVMCQLPGGLLVRAEDGSLALMKPVTLS